MNYGGLILYAIPEQASQELLGAHPSLPQGHGGWLNIYVSTGYLHYDWIDHNSTLHWKSSSRKVTHTSNIPTLGGLNLNFPVKSWPRPWVQGLSHPHVANHGTRPSSAVTMCQLHTVVKRVCETPVNSSCLRAKSSKLLSDK